jgi:hypothetical protein
MRSHNGMRWRGWQTFAVVAVLHLGTSLSVARAQGTGGPTIRDSDVGYIDSALLGDMLRLRYDASFNNPRPTRAEFFWPQGGPGHPGPPRPETSVNYQELEAAVEVLLAPQLSGFVEAPWRLLHPEVNDRAAGFGDLHAGFKYAFLSREDLVATFQLRTYVPTGDGRRGLGTAHTSLEPALLVYWRLDERLGFEGELRDWVPIGGTAFAGNVLRYGAGLHYNWLQTEKLQVVPVVELVGWTVLGGRESVPGSDGAVQVKDAAGDTIVNAKFGLRFKTDGWGDLYTGYGRALTGDRWYANTFRIEWRLCY